MIKVDTVEFWKWKPTEKKEFQNSPARFKTMRLVGMDCFLQPVLFPVSSTLLSHLCDNDSDSVGRVFTINAESERGEDSSCNAVTDNRSGKPQGLLGTKHETNVFSCRQYNSCKVPVSR